MSDEVCRSFFLLVLPTGACQRKGAKHEATMCLKHVHSGSSLSGALINLSLSVDSITVFFCVRKPRDFLDHLSRIIVVGGGHIVFHAFLRCHRHLGPLLTKFNYMYSDRGSYRYSIDLLDMYTVYCIRAMTFRAEQGHHAIDLLHDLPEVRLLAGQGQGQEVQLGMRQVLSKASFGWLSLYTNRSNMIRN